LVKTKKFLVWSKSKQT